MPRLDLLLPSIRVSVQQNAFKQMQDIDIVKTPLGYEAALLGAAAWFWSSKGISII